MTTVWARNRKGVLGETRVAGGGRGDNALRGTPVYAVGGRGKRARAWYTAAAAWRLLMNCMMSLESVEVDVVRWREGVVSGGFL